MLVSHLTTVGLIQWLYVKSMCGGEGKYIWGFSGEAEGKRALGRPKHRWEYIKMYLKEIGWDGVDCIYLA